MQFASSLTGLAAISLVSLGTLMSTSSTAKAAVVSATSTGHGMEVSLQALNVVNLNAGPLPSGVSAAAPAPYNLFDTTLNVNVTASVPVVASGSATANVVSGTAVSDVDGLPGVRTTSASGSVAGAGVQFTTLPVLGPGLVLVGIGNGTLDSSASITGDVGSLAATGSTHIESLTLTIAGIPVDLSAYVGASVAPNTSVNLAALGIANASLVLNEQIIAPDQSSIEVNAFHLSLNMFNSITGSVVLGHSSVSVVAVPEPISVGALGAGTLMLRRRV